MSEKSRHTPGPDEQKLVEAMGILKAAIRQAEKDGGWASDLRTAWEKLHMIRPRVAAAPDLLEAAESLVARENARLRLGPPTTQYKREMDRLRAAIARAKGES
jgi:hypothetical protein